MRMGRQDDGWTAMIMTGDGDGDGLIYSPTTNQSSSPVQSNPVQGDGSKRKMEMATDYSSTRSYCSTHQARYRRRSDPRSRS
jgi:hypothetical protein